MTYHNAIYGERIMKIRSRLIHTSSDMSWSDQSCALMATIALSMMPRRLAMRVSRLRSYRADGLTIETIYRAAGRVFFRPELAEAAWNGAYAYHVFNLRDQPERAIATESRVNTDGCSGAVDASAGQARTQATRVLSGSKDAAVALSSSRF
jgi:hypothetical protein